MRSSTRPPAQFKKPIAARVGARYLSSRLSTRWQCVGRKLRAATLPITRREVHIRMNRLLLAGIAVLALSTAACAQTVGDTGIQDIGNVRRGAFVGVRGEIIRFRDYDELRIQDATGRIDVYLGERGISQPPFRVGDAITVLGWVDDDFFQIPKEIYASEIILEDGTTIRITTNEEWD